MRECTTASHESDGRKLKVGCIIIDEHFHILARGANRSAMCCEGETHPERDLLPAEIVAHLDLLRQFPELITYPRELVMLCTHAPTIQVAQYTLEIGLVSTVIYDQLIAEERCGISMLKRHGLIVRQCSPKLRKSH